MKFFLVMCLILAVFLTQTDAQDICIICKPYIKFPETWEQAKDMLIDNCDKLQEAEAACKGLLNAADLTHSYPKMYPYALSLKDIGCKYYCH